MTDDIETDHDEPRSEARRRVQHPTAPYGTLLYLVQMAHYGCTTVGDNRERQYALGFTRTHAGLLVSVEIIDPLIDYVRGCDNPWDVIVEHIHRALGRPIDPGRGKSQTTIVNLERALRRAQTRSVSGAA